MRHMWLITQVGVFVGLFLWIASGSGCGAKSQLMFEEEEFEEEDPPIDPPDDPLPIDCVNDIDCDDGEFCNGEELCIDGTCDDGQPIDCGEGDECEMAYCDEERDRCVEILIAEDVDDDGFFGSPCGDDCDDTDPDVFPGAPERCNGVDDDCDGLIDENLVEACEDFGRRMCVDGDWTDCMTCTVCIPGTTRYCDTPTYCSWGSQVCNDRGDGWGSCTETSPAPGCSGYAFDQDCCLRSGACCQDWLDTDRDGDYNDSVGACEDVICPAAD